MAASKGTRISMKTKKRIVLLYNEKKSAGQIQKVLLQKYSERVSRQGVYMFLKRWKEDQVLTRKKRGKSGNLKIKKVHKDLIQMWQRRNDEVTASDLQMKLLDSTGLNVSVQSVRKVRRDLGFEAKSAGRTCQLISRKNVRERLTWCLNAVDKKEDFRNVIFTDETTVEMCSTGRLFFHQKSSDIQQKTSRRSRPKHAYKVHVWGGISYEGRTDVCIFTGTMDSVTYQHILEKNLIPFANRKFPNGFRLYQDNDSKHVSKSTKEWMQQRNLLDKVMKTPASSPDINPIENVWSAMKGFLSRTVKPRKRDELVDGIKRFWEGLSAQSCQRYIDHIHRVIPIVILNDGEASGF